MVIHVPNSKTSRMRNIRNSSQALGKVTRRVCQRIMWQVMTDKPKPSTAPPRPEESRFELMSSVSVPYIYLEEIEDEDDDEDDGDDGDEL
jgi:hypothetical protein